MEDQNYDGIPADADKRKFTGIWIPAQIWLDAEISALAKLLYAEIASFGDRGCWKKSEELMEPLGIKRATFQLLCRQLKEHGYISEKRMFGRIVRTTTLAFQSSAQNLHQCKKQADEQLKKQADEQLIQNAVQKEYTKEYSSKELGDANIAEPVEKSKTEYGRTDLNELEALWEHETGISIKGQQNQRRQLSNLVRKYGCEVTKALVRRVGVAIRSRDRFAPQIATPSELTGKFSKLPRLELWENRNKAARPFGNQPSPQMPDYNGAWDEKSDEERAEVSAMMKEFRAKLGAKHQQEGL